MELGVARGLKPSFLLNVPMSGIVTMLSNIAQSKREDRSCSFSSGVGVDGTTLTSGTLGVWTCTLSGVVGTFVLGCKEEGSVRAFGLSTDADLGVSARQRSSSLRGVSGKFRRTGESCVSNSSS